jgi:hypothetical protein
MYDIRLIPPFGGFCSLKKKNPQMGVLQDYFVHYFCHIKREKNRYLLLFNILFNSKSKNK